MNETFFERTVSSLSYCLFQGEKSGQKVQGWVKEFVCEFVCLSHTIYLFELWVFLKHVKYKNIHFERYQSENKHLKKDNSLNNFYFEIEFRS